MGPHQEGITRNLMGEEVTDSLRNMYQIVIHICVYKLGTITPPYVS